MGPHSVGAILESSIIKQGPGAHVWMGQEAGWKGRVGELTALKEEAVPRSVLCFLHSLEQQSIGKLSEKARW